MPPSIVPRQPDSTRSKIATVDEVEVPARCGELFPDIASGERGNSRGRGRNADAFRHDGLRLPTASRILFDQVKINRLEKAGLKAE